MRNDVRKDEQHSLVLLSSPCLRPLATVTDANAVDYISRARSADDPSSCRQVESVEHAVEMEMHELNSEYKATVRRLQDRHST